MLGAAVAACIYKPEVPDGVLRCDEYQRCPAGYICNAARDGTVVTLVCCRTIGCQDRFGTGKSDAEVMSAVDAGGVRDSARADVADAGREGE